MISRQREVVSVPAGNMRLPELGSFARSADLAPSRLLTRTTEVINSANLNHDFILGIGEHLNKHLHTKYESEKEEAIKDLEQRIWRETELIKDRAVAAALDRMAEEHQKSLKKQQRWHERAVKEEVVRITGIIQKQSLEQLQLDRAAAERLHKATIERETSKCAQRKKQAVDEARTHQVEITTETIKATKDAVDADHFRVVSRMEQERENALRSAEAKWSESLHTTADKYKRSETDFLNRLDDWQSHFLFRKAAFSQVAELDREIADQQREISEVTKRKQEAYQLLLNCKKELQRAIDEYPNFDPHQTDYLVPSLTSVSLDNFELRTCLHTT